MTHKEEKRNLCKSKIILTTHIDILTVAVAEGNSTKYLFIIVLRAALRLDSINSLSISKPASMVSGVFSCQSVRQSSCLTFLPFIPPGSKNSPGHLHSIINTFLETNILFWPYSKLIRVPRPFTSFRVAGIIPARSCSKAVSASHNRMFFDPLTVMS